VEITRNKGPIFLIKTVPGKRLSIGIGTSSKIVDDIKFLGVKVIK
jgi:hypothetical protein